MIIEVIILLVVGVVVDTVVVLGATVWTCGLGQVATAVSEHGVAPAKVWSQDCPAAQFANDKMSMALPTHWTYWLELMKFTICFNNFLVWLFFYLKHAKPDAAPGWVKHTLHWALVSLTINATIKNAENYKLKFKTKILQEFSNYSLF